MTAIITDTDHARSGLNDNDINNDNEISIFPVDTAIGKNGRLHTVSRAYTPAVFQLRITMYDINSNFYGVYGGYGENLGEFRWPTGMASDKYGNIYVSDELNHRINIFSEEGKPIKYWGERGIMHVY